MLGAIPEERVAALYSPQEHALPPSGSGQPTFPNVDPICMNLTPRQREVLAVMMQGKSNKAICRVLNLAEPTVKNHITAILKALNVTNRTEAVIKAAKASAPSLPFSYTVVASYVLSKQT